MTQLQMKQLVPEEVKAFLRREKQLPDEVKAAVYGGNLHGIKLAGQFHRDLRVYGLWEALLYVASYEEDGFYRPGTTKKALEAALARAKSVKLEVPLDDAGHIPA